MTPKMKPLPLQISYTQDAQRSLGVIYIAQLHRSLLAVGTPLSPALKNPWEEAALALRSSWIK